VVLRLELELKIIKPVDSVSVRKESETGGSPPGHASAEVPLGPDVVDGLSGLEQAVAAHTAKIHGRESAEKRCETGVIDPPFHDTLGVPGRSGVMRCVLARPSS
jgi:hypothetical protein